MTVFTPSRRAFLQSSGLIIGLALPVGRGLAAVATDAPFQPNAFVRVSPDNLVTIVIKHVEFGQGPATGLATLAADEMDADWAQIRIEHATNNDKLYANLFFGTMATGGSTAIANSFMQMRSAGATARAMLVEAAAKRWGVPATEVKVSKGVVSHGASKANFGELAAAAAAVTPPAKPVLKTPDQWMLIGTDLPKVDTLVKTNGQAMFTLDISRPDMVHAVILHSPVFGGTVKSVDDSAALATPGVVAVRQVPSGVVVYAKDSYAAMRGRSALKVDWDLAAAERRSSEEMFRAYVAQVQQPGLQVEKKGDPEAALKGAARTLEATYQLPYLVHAPMETMDAVMEVKDGRLDVWMGSQFQATETSIIAGVLGIPPEKAVLHQQYAGGSFGRRTTSDMAFPMEAGAVAKAWGAASPVKFFWTRENDIRGGHYRPMVVHKLHGGLDAKGNIVAWDQVIAAQSFVIGTAMEKMIVKDGVDSTMTEGASEGSYEFPNHRVGAHVMKSPVTTNWWRSVGHTHTAYVVETFIDELLALGGKDAVQGRLALMKEAREKGVLNRVAEMAKWGGPVPPGRARGVATHKAFNTYVAQIAEVSQGPDGLPKVHKVWCAVDCGVAVNPNIIRAQMEGGIGFALGHALYAELVLGKGGTVAQGNFDTYRSLRIGEMPEVEVAIIASGEAPTGVGEPGVPPLAPAVGNAWRKLTGKAVRRLPFAHGDNA
ncbi:MAG: xanthine dehydrogenase family protein molybdopterin-binding subunit [Pseudomonadota bacterium]